MAVLVAVGFCISSISVHKRSVVVLSNKAFVFNDIMANTVSGQHFTGRSQNKLKT